MALLRIEQLVSRIAEDIGVSPQQVDIKAKTNEKLGFLGRGDRKLGMSGSTSGIEYIVDDPLAARYAKLRGGRLDAGGSSLGRITLSKVSRLR